MSGNNNTDWEQIVFYICITSIIIVGILTGAIV